MLVVFLILLAVYPSNQQTDTLHAVVSFYNSIANEVFKLNPRVLYSLWKDINKADQANDIILYGEVDAAFHEKFEEKLTSVESAISLLEAVMHRDRQIINSDCVFANSYQYATTILTGFEELKKFNDYIWNKTLAKAECPMHKLYLKWDAVCPELRSRNDKFVLMTTSPYYPGYFLSRIHNDLLDAATVQSEIGSWERMYFSTGDNRNTIRYAEAVGLGNDGKLLSNDEHIGYRWNRWVLSSWEKFNILATCDSGKKRQILRYCDSINLQSQRDNRYFAVQQSEDFSTKESLRASWVLLNVTGTPPKL